MQQGSKDGVYASLCCPQKGKWIFIPAFPHCWAMLWLLETQRVSLRWEICRNVYVITNKWLDSVVIPYHSSSLYLLRCHGAMKGLYIIFEVFFGVKRAKKIIFSLYKPRNTLVFLPGSRFIEKQFSTKGENLLLTPTSAARTNNWWPLNCTSQNSLL